MISPSQAVAAVVTAAAVEVASGGEHVLVIGDSLSKEYEVEFVGLYPDHPDAWDARNWNEILDERRNDWFDLGSFGFYFDIRATGHEFNVSKPGATAREYRNFLRQDDQAETEIRSSSSGDLLWSQFPSWRATFNELLDEAEKVVVFLGGNDLALGNTDPIANVEVDGDNVQVEYKTIYDGGPGDAGNPDRMRNTIRGNVRSVVQYLRINRTYTGPIVICSTPHVGATPKIQEESGTDPVKTARVTVMLELLRDELRAQADEFNCGFADIYEVTKAILDPGAYTIGGISFFEDADVDCGPRHLFSGDGFHPNTPAQAKMAQVILEAFREKYPATHAEVPRLSDREIITDILGLDPDIGFREWTAAASVPATERDPLDDPDGDGDPNLLEYALAGRDPMTPDGSAPATVVAESPGGQPTVAMTWKPRSTDDAFVELRVVSSPDLISWGLVPPSSITANGDGTFTARVPITPGGQTFLRLSAQTIP